MMKVSKGDIVSVEYTIRLDDDRVIETTVGEVPLRTLREVALRLGCGGVGYYPRGKFVHLDSGPFRHW